MLVEKDQDIIGWVISGHLSYVVVIACLIYFITNIRNREHVPNSLKYVSILTFALSALYGLMIGYLRTDLIFPHLDLSADHLPCSVPVLLSYLFYAGSKISMYTFFTYQIEFVFQSSIYGVSPKLMRGARISCGVTSIILFLLMCFELETQEIKTPHYNIASCTLAHFSAGHLTISTVSIVLFFILDTAISIACLCLYCYKLRQMSQSIKDAIEYDITLANKQNVMLLEQIQSKLMKSTILVFACVLSTYVFVWWKHWFMPLDVMVNSVSLCLMYNLPMAQKVYECSCMPWIYLCKYCFKRDLQAVMMQANMKSSQGESNKDIETEKKDAIEIPIPDNSTAIAV